MELGSLGQNGDHAMLHVVVEQECAQEIAMVHSLMAHIVLEAIRVGMNVTHMNVQVSKIINSSFYVCTVIFGDNVFIFNFRKM